MYTCRVLVKHGVSLTPPSDALFSSAATAPACAGDSGFSLLRVRSVLGAKHATVSQVDYELLQWRSAGDWDVSGRKFKDNSLGSAKSGSTGSVSVVRHRSAAREAGVEVAGASISVAERASKFDVSSNCVTPVFRVLPFLQQIRMEDIDDPLYGNMGGPEELVLLRESYEDIRASWNGLM